MVRKKRSPIYLLCSDSDFEQLVKEAEFISDILKYFGLSNKGGNSKTVWRRILDLGVNSEHIKRGIGCRRGTSFGGITQLPLEEVLIVGSSYARKNLKKRLISNNLLANICASCGLTGLWNGMAITLQLEHINGVSNDNRLSNLCLLCPNCHSQTKTFAGRNTPAGNSYITIHRCSCGEVIQNNSINCNACQGLLRRKTLRPDMSELQKMIWELPTTSIAEHYGVSDKAVEKWCKSYGISKPHRGYWQKKSVRIQ